MPSSSASEKGRENKIYRTPSTPPPDVQLEKEKGFVLDCSAVSSISTDYSKTNPKLGPVIPPYNSQKDKHVDEYFEFIGVNETLEKTGQVSRLCPLILNCNVCVNFMLTCVIINSIIQKKMKVKCVFITVCFWIRQYIGGGVSFKNTRRKLSWVM